MGKPTDNKIERKLKRKMGRVIAREGGDDVVVGSSSQEISGGDIPLQAVPKPIPSEVHLQTRRERLLKKIYAKKSGGGAAGTASSGADSNEKKVSGGGVKKKLSSAKKTKVAVIKDNDDETNDGEKRSTKLSRTKKAPKGTTDVGAISRQVVAKSAALASTGPNMQRKTTLNLKSAARHDIFVRELNLFHHVSQLPAFTEDPFGSMQQHLDNTMFRLRPQTPDIGRRDPALQPPSRHQHRPNPHRPQRAPRQ